MKKIEKVAIIGRGALGLLFATQMTSRRSPEVCFVMDEAHYQKALREPATVNGQDPGFKYELAERMKPVDLIVVATKTTALSDAIDMMKYFADKDTIIVSVCNGITSEEEIGNVFGIGNVIFSVAQGMDAVKIGESMTFASCGSLVVGMTDRTNPEAYESLVSFLEDTGVSYQTDEDIRLRQWKKFMLNCGINQSCMVFSSNYGESVTAGTKVNGVFVGAMREVMQLAGLEGMKIEESDMDFYLKLMAELDPKGMPSMAQDRINRKHSEVETFAGTVLKLAQKHQVEVPVNRWLYDEVKRIEAEY